MQTQVVVSTAVDGGRGKKDEKDFILRRTRRNRGHRCERLTDRKLPFAIWAIIFVLFTIHSAHIPKWNGHCRRRQRQQPLWAKFIFLSAGWKTACHRRRHHQRRVVHTPQRNTMKIETNEKTTHSENAVTFLSARRTIVQSALFFFSSENFFLSNRDTRRWPYWAGVSLRIDVHGRPLTNLMTVASTCNALFCS